MESDAAGHGQQYSHLHCLKKTGITSSIPSWPNISSRNDNTYKTLSSVEAIYDTHQFDPGSESDDSYVSINSDEFENNGPPIPPLPKKMVPVSARMLQERKAVLNITPGNKPPPLRAGKSLLRRNPMPGAAIAIISDVQEDLESQHYEELPDCGKDSTKRDLISPPLPPVRNKASLSPSRESSLSLEHYIAPNEEYVPTSEEMSLGDFVQKYQNDFPVRVRVSRGFYGTSDQWSISEDEYFNIHFIKKTKVVSAWDGCFGSYNIPLNSSAKFGFLYMGDGSIEEGIKGYNFTTAGDILDSPNSPPIVKAQNHFMSGKPDQSVQPGDILIVQGNKGRLRKMLKCLDLKSGMQKFLHSNCKGNFTTNPKDIQLFLPEVIEHFTLPAEFVMYINTDSFSNSQEMSFSHRVQLNHCSIETSLIATQLDRRISDGEVPSIIEIPIDLDIGVEIITPREDEAAQLYEETGKLYDTLDVSSIQTIPSHIASLQRDPAAAEALVTCHLKNKNVGVEIQQPPRYSKTDQMLHKQSPHTSSSSLIQNKEVVYKLQMKLQELKSAMDVNTDELKRLSIQVGQLKRKQKGLQSMMIDLQEQLSTGLVSHQSLINTSKSSLPVRTSLEVLSIDEVMKLLRILGLQQYQPLFHSQHLNGKQLSVMTENDLRKHGVAVEHIGPLMNIIQGAVSPQHLFSSAAI